MNEQTESWEIQGRTVTMRYYETAKRGEYRHDLSLSLVTTEAEDKRIDAWLNQGNRIESTVRESLDARFSHHFSGRREEKGGSFMVAWRVEAKRKPDAVSLFTFLREVSALTHRWQDPDGAQRRRLLGSTEFFQTLGSALVNAFENAVAKQRLIDDAKRQIREAEHIANEIRGTALKEAEARVNFKARLEALEAERDAAYRANMMEALAKPLDATWDNGKPVDPVTLRLVADFKDAIKRPRDLSVFGRMSSNPTIAGRDLEWVVASVAEQMKGA